MRALCVRPFVVIAAGVVALSATIHSENAHACELAVPDSRIVDDSVAPADGDALVPLNARVWVGGLHLFAFEEGTGRLLEQPRAIRVATNGVDIDGTITHIVANSGVIGVFTPVDPLAPSTTYDVFIEDEPLSAFTTGQDDDLDAPIIPTATFAPQGAVYAAYSCDGQPSGATVTVGPTFLTLVDAVDGGVFDDENLGGSVSAYSRGAPVFLNAIAEEGPFDARLAAVDIAGNFSGWSEPQTIDVPKSGCTCASSSPAPTATIALSLALVVCVTTRLRGAQTRTPR